MNVSFLDLVYEQFLHLKKNFYVCAVSSAIGGENLVGRWVSPVHKILYQVSILARGLKITITTLGLYHIVRQIVSSHES